MCPSICNKMPFFRTNHITRRTLKNVSSPNNLIAQEHPFNTLLYIHIPRTGGVSITSYFSRKYGIPELFGMIPRTRSVTLNDTSKNTSSVLSISAFVKFAGFEPIQPPVREFDRSIPLQHQTYLTIRDYSNSLGIPLNRKTRILVSVRNPYDRVISDMFALRYITPSNTPDEVAAIMTAYLTTDTIGNHNIPQSDFITDDKGSLIPGIIIIRLEHIFEDMNKIGYTDFNFWVNRNIYTETIGKYSNYLNQHSRELIEQTYKRDFELFEYPYIK